MDLRAGEPRNVVFSHVVRADLRLLEVDDATMQEIMAGGVVIKGEEGEDAVLCTSTRTFAMRTADTTNLVLLVPPEASTARTTDQQENVQVNLPPTAGLQTQREKLAAANSCPPLVVQATVSSHIELVEMAPRLQRLQELLSHCPYGQDVEREEERIMGAGEDPPGFTFQALLERVQASEGELRAALRSLQAVELRGRWRLLTPPYQDELLNMLLPTVVASGWQLDAVPQQGILAAMEEQGYPPDIVRHCLQLFSAEGTIDVLPGSGGAASTRPAAAPTAMQVDEPEGGASRTYRLDPRKVAVHVARRLLPASPAPLDAFMLRWTDALLPHGLPVPERSWLRGEALVHDEGGAGTMTVRALSLASLPHEPAGRFAALFAVQPRWTWQQLEPYLEDLRVPGQSNEALLLKFARAIQQRPTDPVTYCAR